LCWFNFIHMTMSFFVVIHLMNVKTFFHFQSIWPNVIHMVSFVHMVEFIRVLKLIFIAWCSHLWVQFHLCWFFSMLHEFHPFQDFVHVIVLSNIKKIIQMWISSLSFNILYYPNLKLMEMHCFIIQPWYTIAHEFNICSLGPTS